MKRYILALLAATVFISDTDARVSLLKYHSYQNDAATRDAFDAGFDKSTDLIRGYALKLYGTAQIQRFYGNIQYNRGEGEKACSYKDIGNDAVASLLVLLYPSAGPNFNSGGIGALENFFASQKDLVHIVADMLYLANRARGQFLKNSGDVNKRLESIKKLSSIVYDLQKIDGASPDYDKIDKTLSDLQELGKDYANLISVQVIGEERNLIKKQKRDAERLYAGYLERPLAIAKRAKNRIEKGIFDLVLQGDEVFKNWSRSEPKVKTKLEKIAKAIVGSVLLERFDDKELDQHKNDIEEYAEGLRAYGKDLESCKDDFDANKGLKKYKEKLGVYREKLDRYRRTLDINANRVINKNDIDKAKSCLSEDEKSLGVYEKLVAYEKGLDVYKDKLDEYLGVYEKALEGSPYPFGYTNDIICMYAWDVLNSDEVAVLAEHLRDHKKALQKEFSVIDPCDRSFTEEMFNNYKPSIFPFGWGSVFHGTVLHKTSEGSIIEFSDCAETAMRLFCAALFAKYEDGGISLDETRIPEGDLKNFFKGKDLQELSIDGHADTRKEWIKIISGKQAYNAGILFVHPDSYEPADAACELRGTIGNFIWTFCWLMRGYPKLIEKELNIADISNYKAPDSTPEKDLRKINAAKRIDSIVKTVEKGRSVEEKRDIVEKLAETLKQAAKIYNDLLGIRDDVKLEAINTKVANYNSFMRNAKIDGIKIRNVTNHGEYFNLVTNNHAEISSPKSDSYSDSSKISVAMDPNSGFHNTQKLYKEGAAVYEKLYPWLDYCMQVVTDGDVNIGDFCIHARIMNDPLFEDYVEGVCKLLLTKNFQISGHYDEKVNEKRVKRNCNLLMRKIIENTDESSFYERLTKIVEGEYIILKPIIFPLDLDILRTSLKYIESTVSEEDKITSGSEEKGRNDGKASEEENLSEADEKLAEQNRNRYAKKIRNIVNFIDLFDFTSADTDVIESLKKIAECVRKGFEKRGFAQDYLIDVKLNNESDEKVNFLKDICRF